MTGMKNRFVLTYVLLVIAQMLLCNYFHFTPYIMLTILPIMVFCIPTRVSVFWTLIIAFVTGLAVDYFAEGIIGLNAAALLPVAILRRTLIEAIFGPEPFEQEENITVKKYGLAKVSLAIFIITAIFLLIYNIDEYSIPVGVTQAYNDCTVYLINADGDTVSKTVTLSMADIARYYEVNGQNDIEKNLGTAILNYATSIAAL